VLVPETHEGNHSEPSKRNYLLKTDGSGSGTTDDPAQGAIGVVLMDPDGRQVEAISKPIGPAINTEAEYRALIEGLKVARSRGIRRIRVFLDSELVVDQVRACALLGIFATAFDWLPSLKCDAVWLQPCVGAHEQLGEMLE